MKLSAAAAAAIAALVASGVDASVGPGECFQSSCPSMSNSCYACERSAGQLGCQIQEGREECSEEIQYSFTGKTYNTMFPDRCRDISKPDWRYDDPRPASKDFVQACREGYYTCADGTCEIMATLAAHIQQYPACDQGLKREDPGVSTGCNPNNQDDLSKLTMLFDGLNHGDYCTNNGGIRYAPFRCNNQEIMGMASDCQDGQVELNYGTCEENEFGQSDILGPSEACHANCDVVDSRAELPGCCLDDSQNERICTTIELYNPSEIAPRCELEGADSVCNVCSPIAGEEIVTPYCCKDDVDGEGNPTCVDSFGLDSGSQSTSCQGAGENPLVGDVCYVHSSGSTSPIPPVSDNGENAEGLVFEFEMQPPPLVDNSNDCCCSVVCACFGDPHCNSFFADYEVSQAAEGIFTMLEVDGGSTLKVEAEMGNPKGVIKRVYVTIDGVKYRFNAFDGIYGLEFQRGPDGEEPLSFLTDIPEEWTYDRPPRPTQEDIDAGPLGKNNELNIYMLRNPSYLIIPHAGYLVEIKFQRQQTRRGLFAGWWSRIDISIKLETVGTEGCCPGPEQVLEQLGNSVGGFCMRTSQQEESFLPGAMDLTGAHFRRLGASDNEEPIATEHLQKVARGFKTGVREPMESAEDEKLVQRYARVMNVPLLQADVAFHEMGKRELQDSFDETCIEFATDPTFDIENKTPCSEGFTLEVQAANSDEWVAVKFFPRGADYCLNQVKVIYDHITVGGSKLDSSYKIRAVYCSPDPTECSSFDKCTPIGAVDNIRVARYMYGNTLTDAFKERIAYAEVACVNCNNVGLCMQRCVGLAECPAEDNCEALEG